MIGCAPSLLLLHDQTVGEPLNEATELLPHTETAIISLPFFLATAWHTGTSLCYEPMTDSLALVFSSILEMPETNLSLLPAPDFSLSVATSWQRRWNLSQWPNQA
jgi:hypothetical protein